MHKKGITLVAGLSLALCCATYPVRSSSGPAGSKTAGSPTTFNKDVAPILQKQCVVCHMPDGMAPMSLMTYKDARPWAKSIREAVLDRKMPPWHADPRYGEFSNDRRLSKEQIDTIVAWVDGGSLKGGDEDLPAEVVQEGWRIGKPDFVLTMPQEFTLQAEGPDEYQYFVVPTNFAEDRWVQAAEARPGNRRIVHHIIAFVRPPRPKGDGKPQDVARSARPQRKESIFYQDGTLIRVKDSVPVHDSGCETPEGGHGIFMDGTGRDVMPALLCGQAPGRDADVWPAGMAKRIPAGAELLLQIHYSKNGSVEKDRSSIGLTFARQPPEKEIFTEPIQNHYFLIPPGAENHEVSSCHNFSEDVHILSLMPHMHVRGKDMQVKAMFPTGDPKILLYVPNYSFSWQTTYYYKKPVPIARGTRIEVTAHFDNSKKNITNPDPAKTVRWGDPTYDEMMIGWVDYVKDDQKLTSPSAGAAKSGPAK